MYSLLVYFLLPLPFFAERSDDPSPGLFQTKEEARNLECRRLSQAQGHELYPGRVPEPPARHIESQTDVLACTTRILGQKDRDARDELILSSLRQSVGEIVEAASATSPDEVTWQVDAFYPNTQVASKISVAARTELAERGKRVSDRVPLLAAGDLVVLGRLPPHKAYPLACKRYFAEQALSSREALLGLMIVDPREAQLHAGICSGGEWRWLK